MNVFDPDIHKLIARHSIARLRERSRRGNSAKDEAHKADTMQAKHPHLIEQRTPSGGTVTIFASERMQRLRSLLYDEDAGDN